jgi:hypothetical protein
VLALHDAGADALIRKGGLPASGSIANGWSAERFGWSGSDGGGGYVMYADCHGCWSVRRVNDPVEIARGWEPGFQNRSEERLLAAQLAADAALHAFKGED